MNCEHEARFNQLLGVDMTHSIDKKGSSYKSRLQFDIDRTIKQSINWQDFLSKMKSYGYEIKEGKHIAFRSKNQ